MNRLVSIKNKNLNISNQILTFNTPEYIYIKSNNEYKLNTKIYKNNLIGNTISSVSGVITDIKDNNYIIKNDYLENIKKIKLPKIKNIKDLINVLNILKYNNIANKISSVDDIKNLVISSIDVLDYEVNEFMILGNYYEDILDTVDFLTKILKLDYATLVLKSTGFMGIKNVKSTIGTYPKIKVTLVPDKYLMHLPIFLNEFLNIKENVINLTCEDIYIIHEIIKGRIPLNKFVTISGNAIENGFLINTRLNTKLKEIIKEYIKFNTDDYIIYVNGMLSGYISDLDNIIIDKDIDFIVINKKEKKEEKECINCGACKKICPFNINVKKCYFNNISHHKCINCGLCNYICPVNINLKDRVSGKNEEK